MSDQKDKPEQEKPRVFTKKTLPKQKGPSDTSNWDDRTFNAPDGTLVIETDQEEDGQLIITE